MNWLGWLFIGIAAAGVFVAVLSAVMLSSAIDQRQEAVNDGTSGTAAQARGVERVLKLAQGDGVESGRVASGEAAHE